MAIEKVGILAIGPNNIRNNTATSRVFSSNIQMDIWDTGDSYVLDDCAEYGGVVWKCILAHTNQTPSGVSIYWESILTGVHDGDIAISVTGMVDIRQRISGAWISIANRPLTLPLLDNQVVPVEIFHYSGTAFLDAFIDYEIARGNGNVEGGSLRILTDGTANLNFSQDFTHLIGNPQVDLSFSISAGDIVVSYTSANQASPITFKYSLRVW